MLEYSYLLDYNFLSKYPNRIIIEANNIKGVAGMQLVFAISSS